MSLELMGSTHLYNKAVSAILGLVILLIFHGMAFKSFFTRLNEQKGWRIRNYQGKNKIIEKKILIQFLETKSSFVKKFTGSLFNSSTPSTSYIGEAILIV